MSMKIKHFQHVIPCTFKFFNCAFHEHALRKMISKIFDMEISECIALNMLGT